MCKLGLLTHIKYIVPWLLMPWRLTAPGHQQPWYSIFVLVFGHFRFSEFRLYWWIRVLDSVKCPSYLTNYKAFSATKTPWVELCLGSVGEKDGHKILNSSHERIPCLSRWALMWLHMMCSSTLHVTQVRLVILWLAGGTLLEDWRYICCAPSRWKHAGLQWLREDGCQHWCQLHREFSQDMAWYLVWARRFTGVDLL